MKLKTSTLTRLARIVAGAGILAIAAFAQPVGAVYTMNNDASNNKVLMFFRADNGSLSGSQEFATGGRGTGGGLGNQGGLIISPNQQYLFAVNAGSNTVSIFEITQDGLHRVNIFSSHGVRPVSLTMHGNLLYVLNAGSDDIFGFRINPNDTAAFLSGSRARLSGANTGPAQIQFNTQGDKLIVTEKSTNMIDTFTLGSTGRPTGMQRAASAGQTPFGFAVGPRNLIFVSEAAGGAAGASTLGSYRLLANDTLRTVSPVVASTQTAACWVALANGGRLAFTANTGSGTISSFKVAFNGTLKLINASAAITGTSPIDIAVSDNSRFLYVLSQTSGTIGGYSIQTDGSLVPLAGTITGLPPAANGLAAR